MSGLYDDIYSMHGETMDEIIENNADLVYWTIHRFYPTFVKDEDIIQIGFIGLWQAACSYDPDNSEKCRWNTYAVKGIRTSIKGYLKKGYGRNEYFETKPLSLDQIYYVDDIERDSIVNYISKQADVDWVDFESFLDSVEKINRHARTIAIMRYYGYSYAEIGRKLGLTREYIRQIVEKMRKKFDIYI